LHQQNILPIGYVLFYLAIRGLFARHSGWLLVRTTISSGANRYCLMENALAYLCTLRRFARAKEFLPDRPDWTQEFVLLCWNETVQVEEVAVFSIVCPSVQDQLDSYAFT